MNLVSRLKQHFMLACTVLVRPLGNAAPVRRDPLRYRLLSAQEIEHFSADPALNLRADFLRAAKRSRDACVGALDGETLVGYAWLAFAAAPYDDRVWVTFDLRACYAYKVFVRPEWQGQGIDQRLRTAADDLCIWGGKSFAINFIDVANQPAIEEATRAGAQAVAHAGYVQPLGVNWSVRTPGAARFDFSFCPTAPSESSVEPKACLAHHPAAALETGRHHPTERLG